ncbi:MAG TPA: hypothetical protein VF796_14080, partial [Humisphaera sp.]
KPQPAKLFALTQTRVAIDRGVLRCQAHVTYEILHAGVDTLRVSLPAGAELVGVEGQGVRDTQVVDEEKARTLVIGLKDVAKKEYGLTVTYDVHFQEQANVADAVDTKNARGGAVGAATRPATAVATNPAGAAANPAVADPAPGAAQAAPAKSSSATVSVPLIGHPGAAQARGYVGVEVRGGYELDAAVDGAERIDVKELPQQLWSMARSPLQIGYRYQAGTPAVRLSMTRHRDLDVLVAMADVCEATTTVTPDGRAVTKLMYVTRNNLKPFMTLRLPPGAEVWSTFVDDRPVTPVRTADGRVLVPLKRSDDVEDHDDDSYRAKRERRRKGEDEDHRRMIQKAQDVRAGDGDAADLKPYDVEVVFVTPAAKLADRGQLALALPQSDVPVGQLAWAVFVPKHLRVVDADGNAKEVSRFTLPFRHFADVEYAKAEKLAQLKEMAQQQQAAQALEKLAEAQKQLAEAAKVAGVLPVRVEIPVVGNLYRYEKLLVVDEPATLNLTYARKVE